MTFTPVITSGMLNAGLQVAANNANYKRPTTPFTPKNPFQPPTQPTLPSMPTTVPTPTAGVAPIGTPGQPGVIYKGGGMMGDPFYYSRSPEEQQYIQGVLAANPGKRVPDLFNNGQFIGTGGGQPSPHGDPLFPVPGDPNYSVPPPQLPQLPSYQPGYDPYAPIDQLPVFNPNPTQPGTGGGGGQHLEVDKLVVRLITTQSTTQTSLVY